MLLLLALIIILPAIHSEKERYSCPSITHCITSSYKKVPSDLPASIQVLEMVNNHIKKLTSDSFNRYPMLKTLNLEGNSIESISADAFSGLSHLTELDLNHNTRLKSLKNLPSSLETLDLSRCDEFDYDNVEYLSNLKNLKRLNLQDARLTKLPNLEIVGGSLITLDIQDNENLAKIDVADLAPLCKLKNLLVTFSQMEGDLHDCLAVQQWICEYNIQGSNITCGENDGNGQCKRNADFKKFEEMRRNCHLASTWNKYWIYGAGFLATLVFIICSFFVCKRLKCNQISVSDDEER